MINFCHNFVTHQFTQQIYVQFMTRDFCEYTLYDTHHKMFGGKKEVQQLVRVFFSDFFFFWGWGGGWRNTNCGKI